MASDPIPTYAQLPEGPAGGRLGWHVFGKDDQRGTINLLTEDSVAYAVTLVQRGTTFSLDYPLGTFDPPLNPNRGNVRHRVFRQPGGIGHDDVVNNHYPQAGSQWDSLAHIGYTREHYYNSASVDDIESGRRNSIQNWARTGIAGRGVVLDIPSTKARNHEPYDPGSSSELTVEDLEAARIRADVEYRGGDILVLNTGFSEWYLSLSQENRKSVSGSLRAPGLAHQESVCEYLWDNRIAAVVTDTFAVEAWPADMAVSAQPFGFIHQMLIGSLGIALGELWKLSDLVDDCRRTGVFEGLLVASPTDIPGGISSSANALFFK